MCDMKGPTGGEGETRGVGLETPEGQREGDQ